MPKAVRVHETGGPEVLSWDDMEVGDPGPGEVRLKQQAVGLNYIDTYHRSGLYALDLPAVIGLEAAAVVEEVGDGVREFKAGDRVAYASFPVGAYSQKRLMRADRIVKLPDSIDFEQAAGMVLQGMTAEYLIRRTRKTKKGDGILVHAAAGGVGLILCQWGKHLGATVIGTVGTDEKADLAAAHGCDHPIVYTRQNFVERVKEITGGAGVLVVYDGVGRKVFDDSLDCLAVRGFMVSFGNASGPVRPVTPLELSAKGSLYLTRPTLMDYTASREDLLASANALFDVVISGAVKIEVNQAYALEDAAVAHRDLEGRKTTGSTVLMP